MEPEYIERKVLDKALTSAAAHDKDKNRRTWVKAIYVLRGIPAADVAPVVRCRDCIYTRKLYGGFVCKYGTCSGCFLREDFFCANGTRKETRKDGDSDALG